MPALNKRREWEIKNREKRSRQRREWVAKNKERMEYHRREWKQRNPDYYRTWVQNNKVTVMLARIRNAAKKRSLEFTLAKEDLLPLPTHCPVLGLALKYTGDEGITHNRDPNLASVDRIDNSKGYLPGNVIVVSMRANTLKADATPAELMRVARFYAERVGGAGA